MERALAEFGRIDILVNNAGTTYPKKASHTVTEAELKAILAHEFGHFSQKEMKIGSYVYNVNQVIHNLLFENDSFDDTVERWAGISSYFSIFVIPAVKVISEKFDLEVKFGNNINPKKIR